MSAVALPYPHPTSPAVTAVMKGNRKTGTKPEVRLRSALHSRSLRFRKNMLVEVPGLRARPDIVFPRRRVAVFLDGCFWHGCPEHGTKPRANVDYWSDKLARNRVRDASVTKALTANGWTVVRLWEHEPVDLAAARVMEAVSQTDAPFIR